MGAVPPPAAVLPRTGGWAVEACAGSSAGRPAAGTAAASAVQLPVLASTAHD